MCLSRLTYTVLPCMIHTCHAMSMPCSDHAVLLKATAQHDLEKKGMVRAWHGCDMANVNQTQPHCVNQMVKTHSKTLAERHGRGMGTAWARHAMCESAFSEAILMSIYNLKPYICMVLGCKRTCCL